MLVVAPKTSSRKSALFDPAPDHTARVLLAGWRLAEQAVIAAELAAGSAGGAQKAAAERRAGTAFRELELARGRYRQYMDYLKRRPG